MYTSEQLAALETAIASGTLRIRHGDREETFQDLEAMQSLRDRMRRELGLAGTGVGSGPGIAGRARYPVYSKGID